MKTVGSHLFQAAKQGLPCYRLSSSCLKGQSQTYRETRVHMQYIDYRAAILLKIKEGVKKGFLGKSPNLWVGGGQES